MSQNIFFNDFLFVLIDIEIK